jgi:hypothetical protein
VQWRPYFSMAGLVRAALLYKGFKKRGLLGAAQEFPSGWAHWRTSSLQGL